MRFFIEQYGLEVVLLGVFVGLVLVIFLVLVSKSLVDENIIGPYGLESASI